MTRLARRLVNCETLGRLWKRFADWAWPARVDRSVNEDGEPNS